MNVLFEFKKFIYSTLQIFLWIIVLFILKYLDVPTKYLIIVYIMYVMFVISNLSINTYSALRGE